MDRLTPMLAFLRLWFTDWKGKMSGGASIVLTLLGFVTAPTWAMWLFFAAAAVVFVLGSYHVWSTEHKALEARGVELVAERAKSARPDIAVEIQEVYPESAVSDAGTHPNYIDEYYTIKAHLVNRGRPIAVRRFQLYAITERGAIPCQPTTFEHLALERKQRLMPKWGVHYSTVETVQEALTDLSQDRSLIAVGDNREGWLQFVLPEVSGERLKEVTGITLWVVDAESNVHKTTARNEQWRQSGKLIHTYYQELERHLEESKKQEVEEERERNQSPEITGEIRTVDVDAFDDHFLSIELRITSKAETTTISGFGLTLTYNGKSYEAECAPVKEYYVEREILHPAPFETKRETQYHALEDLAQDNDKLFVKGAHRTGWLRFIIRGGGTTKSFLFRHSIVSSENGKQFLKEGVELTLTVYDGYGTPHPIHYVADGKPAPVRIRRILPPQKWEPFRSTL